MTLERRITMKYSKNDCLLLVRDLGVIPQETDIKVIEVDEENETYKVAAINEPILMESDVSEEILLDVTQK